MNKPLRIAVVGHTNAGKTSLLRTLMRLASFGEVSDRPGTTRHVEAGDLRGEGGDAIRFFDTPGLEDSVALLEYLHGLGAHLSPPDRIRRFLAGPEAGGVFEQEAKVLRTLLDIDAALYVLDTREAVLPKYRAEMDILSSCGRPILPVLNFAADARSRLGEWQHVLPEHKLHGSVAFDAVAPATGAEEALYRALVFLLPARGGELTAIWDDIRQQIVERRDSACRVIMEALVDLAALRREMQKDDAAGETARQRLVAELREAALQRMRRAVADLLLIYGFQRDEVDEALLPWTGGRWEDDLFNPGVLQDATKKLGAGAAIGAALGLAADVALGGLSLGAGMSIGAAAGGVASQGFGALGRKLANRARGILELSLENEVLWVAAGQLFGLQAALERRGHAAQGRISPAAADKAIETRLKKLMVALQPARALALPPGELRRTDRRRVALAAALQPAARELADALASPGAAGAHGARQWNPGTPV
ncbi:GTPase/DUF3482 domain-containing protein [Noviherbaspirillum aridicola]|uniref:GTPase SAR1 n=1 Tax=Noviherbaspirillum aridicola TaxID=2849687 RepID=A0ABQ4Q6H0_9BURK|nr:GTPase/DUF3482 domain-containing protein [Noviherbaspirillum aridicola]GIZ52770.1 GTPase SAR1 [Noviherbaspirillum aridicola]